MAKLKEIKVSKVGETWIEIRNEETVEEFLDRGGKITHCEPMKHSESKFSRFGYIPLNGRKPKRPWSDELSETVDYWREDLYDAFSS